MTVAAHDVALGFHGLNMMRYRLKILITFHWDCHLLSCLRNMLLNLLVFFKGGYNFL